MGLTGKKLNQFVVKAHQVVERQAVGKFPGS